jgi:hypothetical protein
MALGDTNHQAAKRLGTTEAGTRMAVHRAIRKLDARSTVHAVHLAVLHGLIGWYEDCGDRTAYRRHLRNGEPPCPKCRRANASGIAHWREQNLSDPTRNEER